MSCPLEAVQTGELSLYSRLQYLQYTMTVDIEFDVPFNENGECPQVGILLHHFDLNKAFHTNINALPHGITRSGFKLDVGTWDEAQLWSLKVYWIASTHPAVSIINIEVGSRPNSALPYHSLRLFYPAPYEDPPKIVAGINRLEIDKSSNRRLRTHFENVTSLGFTLVTSTWGDTKLWCVGYSLIILSQSRLASTVWQARGPQHEGVQFKRVPEDSLMISVPLRSIDFFHAFQEDARRGRAGNLNSKAVILAGILGLDICNSSNIRMETLAKIPFQQADSSNTGVDFLVRTWEGSRVYGGQISTLVLNSTICVGGNRETEDLIQRRTILEQEFVMNSSG
jgi:hypothetical protein